MPVDPDPRRIVLVIWAVLLGGCLSFLAVASYMRSAGMVRPSDLPELLAWIALGFGVLLVALSFTVPGQLRPLAGATPEVLARSRLIVAWALREGAALFGMVVWLLSGDAKALAAFAIGFAALAATPPTEDRWRGTVEASGGSPGRPPVRS
jgi:hypothetical protein